MPPSLLHVKRDIYSDKSTIGILSLNNERQCYTLEPTVRKFKIDGETAIPTGKYKVAIAFSNRYQRPMPYVLDVNNFVGIMIHCGNKANHTRGCILVGETMLKDFIGYSQKAFDALYPKIEIAVRNEGLLIQIS